MDSPNSSHRGTRTSTPGYKRHGSRYKARRRAVDIIFEAEARDVDPVAICDERSSMACQPDSDVRPVNAYTRTIVEGVAVELNTVDDVIVKYLTDDWELGRIAATDRAILRVIVWEMLFSPDVPAKVAVVEATELASQYSDAASPAYINAMLDRMAGDVPELKARINQYRADDEAAAAANQPEPESADTPAETVTDSDNESSDTPGVVDAAEEASDSGEQDGQDGVPADRADDTGSKKPVDTGAAADAPAGEEESAPKTHTQPAEPDAGDDKVSEQSSPKASDSGDNDGKADGDNTTGGTQISNWVI